MYVRFDTLLSIVDGKIIRRVITDLMVIVPCHCLNSGKLRHENVNNCFVYLFFWLECDTWSCIMIIDFEEKCNHCI